MRCRATRTRQALDQAISVMRKRLDTLGTREISIQPEGTDRLKIQIPGLQGAGSRNRPRRFCPRWRSSNSSSCPQNASEILAAAAANGGKLPYQYALDYEILPDAGKGRGGQGHLRPDRGGTQGADVGQARDPRLPLASSRPGNRSSNLEFDSEGKQQFGDITTANVGRQLAIVLDHDRAQRTDARRTDHRRPRA